MSTVNITVELPAAAHRVLRALVESGDFASESEAVAEALLTLSLESAQQPAFEPGNPEFDRWIQEDVLPALDEMEAHPESLMTGEQVRAYLEQQRHLPICGEDRLAKTG